MSDTVGEGPAVTPDPLEATLRVQPAASAGCVVTRCGPQVVDVGQNIMEGDDGEPSCRASVTRSSGDRTFVADDVSDTCICPVFRSVDCVASIEGFHDGELTVEVTVPDRATLRELVEQLRDRGASVRLHRLREDYEDAGERTIELDASEVTDKQREALETARRLGYFDSPRTATLQDVAAELGVSSSAVSQRINAVEDRLLLELLRAERGERPGE